MPEKSKRTVYMCTYIVLTMFVRAGKARLTVGTRRTTHPPLLLSLQASRRGGGGYTSLPAKPGDVNRSLGITHPPLERTRPQDTPPPRGKGGTQAIYICLMPVARWGLLYTIPWTITLGLSPLGSFSYYITTHTRFTCEDRGGRVSCWLSHGEPGPVPRHLRHTHIAVVLLLLAVASSASCENCRLLLLYIGIKWVYTCDCHLALEAV